MSSSTVISASVVGEIAYLTICGRVVHGEGASAAIQRAIHKCAASYFNLLVVNLRRVYLMDAAGLSTLVDAYAAAQSLGAGFALADVPPRVSQILAVTRLDTIFWTSEAASRKP